MHFKQAVEYWLVFADWKKVFDCRRQLSPVVVALDHLMNVKLSPTNIRCRPLAPNLASAIYLTAHVKRALGGNDPFIN